MSLSYEAAGGTQFWKRLPARARQNKGKGRRKGKTIKPKILQSRKGKKQHLLMGTMDSMLVNITLLSAWKNAWTVAEETGGLSEQLEQA